MLRSPQGSRSIQESNSDLHVWILRPRCARRRMTCDLVMPRSL